MSFFDFLFFYGRSICHQIPERTIFIDNMPMPVCARDTGIYIGLMSTFLFLFFTKKYKSNMIPDVKTSLFLWLFVIPIGLDGVSSYIGFRETTNDLRIITGIPLGVMLPFFLIPLINFNKEQSLEIRSLDKWYQVSYPLILSFLIAYITYQGFINYYLISTLVVLFIFIWFGLLIFAFIKGVKFIKSLKYKVIISLILVVAFLTTMSHIAEHVLEMLGI